MKILNVVVLVMLIVLLSGIYIPSVFSKIGVGVGTGKIIVDEKLKPGGIYNLPSITVYNTGDQTGDYLMHVTYHEGQKEIRVPEDWVKFDPKEFTLNAKQAQEVLITLSIPVKGVPGDYFGYLEAQPYQKSQGGMATIAIAAATKLYFTVVPASLLQGIYYRISAFWKEYSPWTNIALGILIFVIIILIIKRFIKVDVSINKPKKEKKNKKSNNSEVSSIR